MEVDINNVAAASLFLMDFPKKKERKKGISYDRRQHRRFSSSI